MSEFLALAIRARLPTLLENKARLVHCTSRHTILYAFDQAGKPHVWQTLLLSNCKKVVVLNVLSTYLWQLEDKIILPANIRLSFMSH
jgi:hypothetical protein